MCFRSTQQITAFKLRIWQKSNSREEKLKPWVYISYCRGFHSDTVSLTVAIGLLMGIGLYFGEMEDCIHHSYLVFKQIRYMNSHYRRHKPPFYLLSLKVQIWVQLYIHFTLSCSIDLTENFYIFPFFSTPHLQLYFTYFVIGNKKL
jgi:hypothetical protein